MTRPLFFRLPAFALRPTSFFYLLLLVGVQTAGATAAEPPAQSLVRTTAENFLERMRTDAAENAADPQHIITSAEALVLPHFDFELMSQRALGRYWRDFSAEQRARFVAEFRTLMLRTYANTLNDYRDAKIAFLPSRQLAPEAMRVRTEVARPSGGAPVQIDYEVRQQAAGWKICDVALNGVSLIISYRAGFAKDIGTLGVEGVIAQLAERNQQPL
jgi:phospholipid transport system substrate-binding protein